MKRLNAINLLRFLAALSVFILHVTVFTPEIGVRRESTDPLLFFIYPSAWLGVDIFFVLGGYLAGRGFASGRYVWKAKSVFRYYLKRFLTVLLPTWIYCFIFIVLSYPNLPMKKPELILSLVLCYFNGGSVDGLGSLWFVFTIVQLYFITPFLHFLIQKGKDRVVSIKGKSVPILWFVLLGVVLFGISFRVLVAIFWRDNWYDVMYTSLFGNFDLYAGGMVLAYIPKPRRVPKKRKDNFVFYLGCFLTVNAFLCYCTEINPLSVFLLGDNAIYIAKASCGVLWYAMPTLGLLFVLAYLYFCDNGQRDKKQDGFSSIAFGFYLVHSIILKRLTTFIAQFSLHPVVSYLFILVFGFAISSLFAIGIHDLLKRLTKLAK